MQESLQKAIEDFITAYENSSLRQEELRVDGLIAESDKLSILAQEAKKAMDEISINRHDPEPVRRLASIKKEYYSDELVRRRMALSNMVKRYLNVIEHALDESLKDEYKGL